jgi:CHAT domain-containing protein
MKNVHVSIGRAAIAQAEGSLREAEINYRRADEDAPHVGYLDGLPDLRSDLAENLLQQGRAIEAEVEARKAVDFAMWRFGYSGQLARSVIRLADSLFELERIEDAEYLARLAIRTHEIDCSPPESLPLAHSREILARSLALKGDWEAALAQFKTVEIALAHDPQTLRRVFGASVDWPMALIHAGQPSEALARLTYAIESARERHGPSSYAVAELVGIRAVAHHAVGDTLSAIEDFQAAIPVIIDSGRGQQGKKGQFTRDFHIRQILENYMLFLKESSELQEDTRRQDAVSEAFRVASALGGRGVERALAAQAARGVASDTILKDMVRREQDTVQRISAVAEMIANLHVAPEDQYDASLIPPLQQRLIDLRSARSALVKEIEARFPDYAKLVNPKPSTIEQARAALRSGEALIATYVGEDRSFVWAIPERGEVAFATAPLGRAQVASMTRRLRGALEPGASTLGDIPAFDVALAHELYEKLLAPVESGWRGAESLLVVTHGPLGQLPFSLLVSAPSRLEPEREPLFARYGEVPWLARSHVVTVLPSVSSLVTLRALPQGDPARRAFAGFADPWFSLAQASAAEGPQVAALESRGLLATRGLPVSLRNVPKTTSFDSAQLAQLPRLPDTAEEVRSIALALNADLTRDVFIGKEASEGRVKTMDLLGYRVLAFATHGLVPGDLNGLSQPALALTSPSVSGEQEDGLLTLGEILGLKLDADWVVLSACNTGAAEGAGGRQSRAWAGPSSTLARGRSWSPTGR